MISEAKKRRFLSVKVSLSYQAGDSGRRSTTASMMVSMLKPSCADAGMTVAAGTLSCHQAISSCTFSWLLMSILLMTMITGHCSLESFSTYSVFLSGFSTVSVT